MTTNNQDSGQPTTAPDAAVTAILADWSTPVAGAPAAISPDNGDPAARGTTRPTVRWGALVWALIFGATAATTLWVVVDPARRDAVGGWLTSLSPLAAVLYAFIALGVVVAMFGIVGLLRRGERTRR
ncbi:hypothetical protein [Agromyces badenianii]|uniref:hypothetical protein n=1 Tax=Agromyces badenianii TaxID=2080742 RepID=UPI000D597B22|nr:hypothetical protein [Agromyces badenianii]PWC03629.1 hypothetical protein DCE94_11495 [Agromyces badenianii]